MLSLFLNDIQIIYSWRFKPSRMWCCGEG